MAKHNIAAGRKRVCNGSRNTPIFGKISEINYMFRPLIEWAIIRLKQEIPASDRTTGMMPQKNNITVFYPIRDPPL
jgi:hypothetical protein